MKRGGKFSEAGTGAALFILALGPRVLSLDAFLTPDEFLWVYRSVHFFAALVSGNLGSTFITGHPGVTTMWTGVLGLSLKYLAEGSGRPALLTFLRAVPVDPLDVSYIPAVRIPTALITAAFVVALYFLTRELFDSRIALLAAILLALEPFHLALSRVMHHDALVTACMTISLLGAMIALRRRSFRYLVFSGCLAGLAFLTKSVALFLIPFVGLFTIVDQRRIRPLVKTWLVWVGAASVTCVAFWPAMWVAPLAVIRGVWATAAFYASTPHDRGSFFWGHFRPDPGGTFYLVNGLFRLTPLVLLGLGGALIGLLGHRRTTKDELSKKSNVLTLVVYVVLFTAFLTVGDKKLERYLLPIFPVVDILAAVGLWTLWRVAGSKFQFSAAEKGKERGERGKRREEREVYLPTSNFQLPLYLVFGCLILQAGFALPHHPYYLTWYNPLLGGIQAARRTILVGWGEGLDEAARYLNAREEAADLKVVSWYHMTFAPFFRGETWPFPYGENDDEDSDLYLNDYDYAIIYVNQVQRQEAYPYNLHGYKLERAIRLKGLDYAWVYRRDE